MKTTTDLAERNDLRNAAEFCLVYEKLQNSVNF